MDFGLEVKHIEGRGIEFVAWAMAVSSGTGATRTAVNFSSSRT